MIELKINGENYSEEEFKRDYVRMMDSLRKVKTGKGNCAGVNCFKCPLNEKACGIHDNEDKPYKAFKTVEIVYNWSKEHPIKTNRDKIREVFGIEVISAFFNTGRGKVRSYSFSNVNNEFIRLNALSQKDETFRKWLDSEYEEPKKND